MEPCTADSQKTTVTLCQTVSLSNSNNGTLGHFKQYYFSYATFYFKMHGSLLSQLSNTTAEENVILICGVPLLVFQTQLSKLTNFTTEDCICMFSII